MTASRQWTEMAPSGQQLSERERGQYGAAVACEQNRRGSSCLEAEQAEQQLTEGGVQKGACSYVVGKQLQVAHQGDIVVGVALAVVARMVVDTLVRHGTPGAVGEQDKPKEHREHDEDHHEIRPASSVLVA